jgi:hypothetical protein
MSTPQRLHYVPLQVLHKQRVEERAILHPFKQGEIGKEKMRWTAHKKSLVDIRHWQTCTFNVVLYKGSNCPDGIISKGTS